MSELSGAAEASDQQGEASAARISVGAPEYDAATSQWVNDTVRLMMRAIDPVYAALPRESFESVASPTVQFDHGDDLVMQPARLSASLALDVQAMIEGDLEELHIAVESVAQQTVKQIVQHFAATMDAITAQTGNVIDGSAGDWVDSWIDMLERIDMAFDEDGRPTTSIVAHPDAADRMRERMENMTPDQRTRFSEVMARKKAEFDASRRRRRLPRLSH